MGFALLAGPLDPSKVNRLPMDSARTDAASETRSAARTTALEPPPPPAMERRFALTRKQKLGLPLLAAIPILTLFGVFGERRAETRLTTADFAASIRNPERFRYRQVQSLDVTVTNLSPNELDTVTVSLDTAYISRFSSVRIEPAPSSAFVVDLVHLKPGTSRLVSAELWGERYGRQQGVITVATKRDSASTRISTLVFP